MFDAVGNDIRVPEHLPRRAEQVAQSEMRTLNDQEDRSEWRVTMHDLSGRQVLVQPFVTSRGELNQAA